MKPIIGISSNYIDDDLYFRDQGLGSYGQTWSAIANDYVNAVYRAGGIPVVIPISEDQEMTRDILDTLDGVLMSGGNDVDTYKYHERPQRKLGRIHTLRDNQDLFIVDYMNKAKKPIFGICRGLQILNVAFGGTLIQDIPSEGYLDHGLVNNERYYPSHTVIVEKGSRLYDAYRNEEILVNSYHHQGVKVIGKGLKPVAWTEDNLCEAVELDAEDHFVLGVQWHPEMMSVKHDEHLRIFKDFVEACRPSVG